MPVGSIPCPACGQPVPADLPACASCGTTMTAAGDGLAAGPELEPEPRPEPEGRDDASATADAGPEPEAIEPTGEADVLPPRGQGVRGVAASPVLGAYLPPSTIRRLPPASSQELSSAPTASSGPASPPSSPAPGTWAPVTPVPPQAAPTVTPSAKPGRASLLADLPFDAPDSLAEWLVAIGSGVGSLGFLLPWTAGTVSYLSSWGLSSASRLPVLALLVVTAVLAILPNRVAIWVRLGVLGLIGGSLYLGLLWPFVLGDFGGDFGAAVGAAAAIVLIAGGVVGVAPRATAAKPS
jgi:hypothetical protein